MIKLLINCPEGKQQVIDIDVSGGYFESERVIWDERKDGELPEDVTIGKMVRDGKGLKTLNDYLPEHLVWVEFQQAIANDHAKKSQLENETKNDSEFTLLRKMSASEIDDWFTANITNANQLLKFAKKLTKVLVKQNLI